MRILFVSPNVPWPPDSGGRIRTFKLIEALQPACEIHLRAVLAPGQDASTAEPLRKYCASVQTFPRANVGPVRRWSSPKLERWFHSSALQAALVRELDDFDLVHLDEMFMTRAIPATTKPRVCVHHHKLDTVLHEQLPQPGPFEKNFDLWKLRKLEAESARRFSQHVVCSAIDASILCSRYPRIRCGVVENGFDPGYFDPDEVGGSAKARETDRLLFLGSMSYGPNVEAVQHLVGEILPLVRALRPGLILDIVGADPGPKILALASDSIRVTGRVDDVRPYLRRAACLVAPLRIGGGTRLKLVEALGMRTPIVSSFIGAQGLDLEDAKHLRLAHAPVDIAQAVLEVLADPAAADVMAQRGRRLVLERYTWKQLGERLLRHWERFASDQP